MADRLKFGKKMGSDPNFFGIHEPLPHAPSALVLFLFFFLGWLVKEFFKEKKLLEEITLTRSIWQTHEFYIPEEVGQEVILLVKVSRTWKPLKTNGAHDPRNLGVAVGRIEFEDKLNP